MWYVLAFLAGSWFGFIITAFMIGAHSNEDIRKEQENDTN